MRLSQHTQPSPCTTTVSSPYTKYTYIRTHSCAYHHLFLYESNRPKVYAIGYTAALYMLSIWLSCAWLLIFRYSLTAYHLVGNEIWLSMLSPASLVSIIYSRLLR
ncbi:hypothetical protein F4777DRAFT_410607 [Nemania sp. FL0916]|nr:hypothetical protein F4777DRAFT_410607 [Nemania sp. FL0916]